MPYSCCLFTSVSLTKISCSILRLVTIVDLLTLGGLSSHGLIDLAEHLLAHHVHHGVDSASHLLRLKHLLGWGHHQHRWFQHVHILWIVHVVNQVVQLELADATLLEEVLTLVEIEAHLSSLLEELFLLVHEVLWNQGRLLCVGTHR